MYEITHLPSIIEAGVTGEKGMRRIQIDMRPWLVDMPDGVASMVLIRPGETSSNAYIAATTFTDGILTWSPALADLGEVEGYGQMEIWLEKTQNSSVVKRGKSAKVQTFIRQSIADETGPIPEAQESWLEQMTALKTQTVNAAASVGGVVEQAQEAAADAEEAKEAAEAAAAAAMSAAVAAPEIRNGTWWIFNTVTSEWEDTEVSATGPAGPTGSTGPKGDPGDDGVTPEIAVTSITGGHRVAITDGSGTNTFDVMDGAKGETGNTGATGATPNLTIGTVSTLNPGQSATATITGTAENPVLNMGIPKGQTGDDGVSPEITVTDITGGHRVAVTDGSGTETFDVMDGAKGETGNTGATGATPNLTIGTVTTLNPDQSATATITGTAENPVLNMGIPRGQTGSIDSVYGTTIPVSESDSRNIKQVLDLKLESVPVMDGATSSVDGTAGLVPAPEAGDEDKVLMGDGSWGTVVTDPMTGATASTDGAAGLVPAPEAGDQDKVLTGGGTWREVAGQELLGYKENGDTASQAIADGSFVVWKGDLYKANGPIPQGTAFSSSNLTAVPSGGFNNLQNNINLLSDSKVSTSAIANNLTTTSPGYVLDARAGKSLNDNKVSGPSAVTDNRVAIFDGTTGKAIKDSGYTIAKSVPSDAKFTDTNTWRGIQNSLTSTSTTDSLSAAQGKVLNDKLTNQFISVERSTLLTINARGYATATLNMGRSASGVVSYRTYVNGNAMCFVTNVWYDGTSNNVKVNVSNCSDASASITVGVEVIYNKNG